VNIPQTVNHDGTDYEVTAIDDRAFRDKQLTGVTFSTPSNVTSIGRWAFTLNKLRSVTIPSSVTSIEFSAFSANRLTRVVFKGTDPPSLGSTTAFGLHEFIAVVVPDGALNDYETAWSTFNFKSFTEEGDITIDTFTVEGIKYEYKVTTTPGSPGTVSVIGIGPQNAATSINIPENVTYQGTDFEITGIDAYAFFMENNLTSVTIGQNVTSIGYSAFYDNNLTSVDIPNSVTSIGDHAFQQNALESVTIPNRMTSIGEHTFFENKLTSVTIPNSVTSIGTSAFWGNNLSSVTIPNSVTSIGGGAFRNNKLTEVTIPEGLTDLPGGIFENNALTSVTIPNSVTRIGHSAFEKNALTSVTIPGNVTSIQQWAFAYNPDLSLVTLEVTHPPSLHAEAFKGRDLGTIDVVVPWGKRQIYLDNGWTSFNNITEAAVKIGDTFTADHITYEVTSIAPNPNTFKAIGYNTAGGSTVTIPQTVNHDGIDYEVTAIGNSAFHDKQLDGVAFSTPSNVTSIEDGAFRNNDLNNVAIPNSVTSIGIEAFQNNDLTSVTLPNNITSIANSTFQNNDLTSVDIPGSVTSIGTEAFRNNKFTSVTIPENVISIGPFAFANNPTIHTVVAQGVATVPIIVTANTFSNRHLVHVLVPGGKRQDYLDNGWTGFSSITEVPEIHGTFTAHNITYEITSITPNTVKATGYTTTGGTATIPPTVDHGPNTYTVTRIEARAFEGSQLERVTISENVTSIGPFAFANNPIHTVVAQGAATVPIIVTANTFSDRGQIHVFVPKGSPAGSIKSAYEAAGWRNFASITEALVIGDTFIADQITYKITAISPNTVTAIDYNTTGGAVTIPQTVNHDRTDYEVTAIGNEAFYDKQLTGVAFRTPSNVTSIGSKAFLRNELAHVTIPNSVETIGSWAFASNQLTSVEIPNSVTSIPFSAFRNNDLTSVEIPDNVTSIGGGAFAWNDLTSIEIPNNVTSIGHGAFRSNDLRTVTIPNSVTRIGDDAFKNNTQLTSVTIPNSVTSIGVDVFSNNDLTSVEIPKSVTSIGNGAFAYNRLTSVDIPNRVTSIGSNAFLNNDLTSVTIPNSVTSIGRGAFRNNDLTSVEIPNSVTSIGDGAFAGNKLNSVTIPNSVETIGGNAFGDNQLSSLEIPNGVTSIGQQAFRDNDLTSVIIPNSVTRIEDQAFQNNKLTSVTLPNSVEIIDNWTFVGNQLTEVTIPGSVTSIRVKAFYENPGLGLVRVNANDPPAIHAEAFENADRGQIDLIVPIGKEQAYLDKGWTDFKSITEGILVSIKASAQEDNLASFPVTITFGENVTGFSKEDIDVVNATVVDGSFSPVNGPASKYVIELTPVTPTSCESTITIDVPADAATGVNSSSNLPARTTVTVSDPPMTPQLSTTVSTICAGQDAMFTITGAEGDRVTYNDGTTTRTVTIPAGGTTTVPVSGVSPDVTLTLTEVTRGNCNVAIPSTNTTAATVTVNAIPSASAFTVSSNAAVLCAGDDAIFTITGTEGEMVTYDDGTSTRTVTIPAGGTTTVTIDKVSANATLRLTQVSNGNCNISLSKMATVTVNDLPMVPQLSTAVSTVCAGQDAIFTITGAEGDRVTYDDGTLTRTVTIPAGGTATVPVNGVSSNTTLTLTQVTRGNCNISFSKMATVTVNDLPMAPSVNSSSLEYCVGQQAEALTATGDNLLWYTSPTDQTGDANAPTPNTTTASTTFHYVSQRNSNGCESDRTKIEVIVKATPSAPLVSSPVEYCVDETATALTATGDNLLWYTSPTDDTGDADAPVPATTTAGTTSWYVTQTTNGCESDRTKIEVTVNAIPPAPSVNSSSVEYCVGQPAEALTATGDNLLWYTSPTDQTGDVNAPTPNTATARTTFHYVSQKNSNGCESQRTEIEVIVKATPSAPSVSNSSVQYCVGDDARALTATGDNLSWYTSPTDQTGSANAPTPNTATASTTFHYVSQRNSNGCESDRTVIMVTVEACPAQIGDVFTASGMDYEITSLNPNKVKVIDYISSATAMEIPETVDHKDETYTVTAIGPNAFRQKQLTGVTIPEGVTSIGTSAFRNNELTGVTIPNDVTSIGISAFRNNELTEVTLPDGVTSIDASAFVGNTDLDLVTVEATHPPFLHENAFADRSQINLVVPVGMRQAYLDNGWDGFRWIAEEGEVITAVSNDELNDLTLYPNPAKDKVHIDLGSGQRLKQVNIYTMTGAYLYSESGLEINTGRLSEGMYLFEIVTKTGNRSMKKVIIR